MKKIILINPENSGRSIEMPIPPFGLMTIASIFKKRGIDVVWIDADILRNHSDQIHRLINDNKDADLIAIGGLHTAYSFIKDFFQYLSTEKIDIPTILGGRIAQTLDYLLWEKIPNLKIICKQEGEYVVESLCDHFPYFEKVLGIEYKKEGRIIKNPPAPIINSLDELPDLPWDTLNKKYFENGTGNVLTGRGCPFTCNFCRKIPEKYRISSIPRVIDEIRYLIANFNLHTIVVMDEFFLQNKNRVAEFSEGMMGLNIVWRCTSRADGIKENDLHLLKKMKRAGCRQITMGIESASQKILDNMGKKLKVSYIENAVQLIRKAGMGIKAGFIFGYPGESWQTAMETVNWRIKMNLNWRHFYATPYPGSKLYDYFKNRYNLSLDDEERWIIKSPGLKRLQVNLTDLSMDELRRLDKECLDKLLGRNKRMKKIYQLFKLKVYYLYLMLRKKLKDYTVIQ